MCVLTRAHAIPDMQGLELGLARMRIRNGPAPLVDPGEIQGGARTSALLGVDVVVTTSLLSLKYICFKLPRSRRLFKLLKDKVFGNTRVECPGSPTADKQYYF